MRTIICAVSLTVCFVMNAAADDATSTTRPGPVDAETAVTRFELPDDLRIELVAAEPDVIDPVAMTFDAEGQLWVVEMSDYPNGPPKNGPPLSRVRVLSDSDGDGRYSNPVIFADKLLFANGLLLWKDGLLVTTDGEVLFLRDTDGDGAADKREVWFRGFKRDNPQLRANHPTLGLDNQISIASGLRGGEVIAAREDWADGAEPVSLSGRDFRFDPLTGEYESISGVGQFGLCFDDFGNRFVCSNRNPCNHIVLEDRYLARNPNFAVAQVHEDVSPAAEKSKLYPISRIWTTSNLHANQFTAACGVLIYRGDALPEQYRGNSFTCEPTSNLVHRDVLSPHGATFTSRPGRERVEFLATKDEWFRPVNLTHGPDGALYLADMYRAVIEHPEFMPVELKERPDLTDGRDRGRIYRIVPKSESSPRESPPKLSELTAEQLVSKLESSNPWMRDTAARLLLQSQDASIVLALGELATDSKSAATRVQALWLLDGIGQLTRDAVEAAFDDASPRVQEQALLLAERRFADDESFRDDCLRILTDPASDDRLAFQAALSIGSFPQSESIAPALAHVVSRSPQDRWLRAAVATSASKSLGDVLKLTLDQWRSQRSDREQAFINAQFELTEQYAESAVSGGRTDAAAPLLATVANDSPTERRQSFALLRGMARGLRRSGQRLESVVTHSYESTQQAISSLFDVARSVATDTERSSAERVEAIALLAEAPAEDAIPPLSQLLAETTDQQLALATIASLSRMDDPQVAAILLEGFRHRTPRLRTAILAAMTTNDRIELLLDEIEAGRISPRDIDASLAQRMSRLSDKTLKARADKLLSAAANSDRLEVVRQYHPALMMEADLQRGRAVFARTCATCHRVGEVGVNVGADISDTRVKTPEQLLTNILDPNRAVDGNYFGYSLVDTEGRVHTGIIAAETASSVTLRQAEGKDATFLRKDIEQLVSSGMSLMPVGLEKNIDLQQMADLIAFLKNWRYVDGAVPEKVILRGNSE